MISGIVIDAETLSPIVAAEISIVGLKRGTYSGKDGRFTLTSIPAGIRAVRVRALGYQIMEMADVAVSTGKPTTLSVRLTPSSILADTAVVVANSFTPEVQLITSTATFNSEEVRRFPGVQEDVVRAISILPGVAVSSAGRNDIAVRGGAPFENLFVVDNIEVPNINHFGSQGSTGGPLSLINVDLVDRVSLSTGGFGSKFGDRLSSVTDLSLRSGNREAFSGEVNLSTTGFSVISEGPISTSGSWLAAARRSYLDLIFNLAGFGFVPEYWDFTLKTDFNPTEVDEITFLAIGALDKVTFNNSEDNLYSNSRVTAPSQNQYFAGVSWKHLYEEGYVVATLGRTYSNYLTVQQDSLANTIFRADTKEGENSLCVDAVWIASPELELNVGASTKFASDLTYRIDIPGYARLDAAGAPAPLSIDTSFTALKIGANAQASWRPVEPLTITLGGRVDNFSMIQDGTALSPRLSVRFEFSPEMSLAASGGRYHQSPQYIWLVGDSQNINSLSQLRTDQVVLSWQYVPLSDLKIQIEGYYKYYSRYPARVFRPQAVVSSTGFDDIYTDIPFGLEPLDGVATGTSYGAEILVQKRLSQLIPIYGLFSLTINSTEFTSIEQKSRTGSFDTPVILSFSIGWRPSDLWELSGKVRASRGAPTTPYITTSEQAEATGFPIGSLDFTQYNEGQRLPTFFALDLRVDKRWFFEGWQLITYIDVQNATGRENVTRNVWNQQTQQVESNRSIGVLPSIGINIEF